MSIRLDRLRGGEILSGAAGVALAVVLFRLGWYRITAPSGGTYEICGWQAFSLLRIAILVSALLGVALALTQMTQRAPAIPVSVAVVQIAAASLSVIWTAVRVIFAGPSRAGTATHLAGGWVTLALLLVLAGAGIWSLRQEGLRPADGPGEIPTLDPWSRPG